MSICFLNFYKKYYSNIINILKAYCHSSENVMLEVLKQA